MTQHAEKKELQRKVKQLDAQPVGPKPRLVATHTKDDVAVQVWNNGTEKAVFEAQYEVFRGNPPVTRPPATVYWTRSQKRSSEILVGSFDEFLVTKTYRDPVIPNRDFWLKSYNTKTGGAMEQSSTSWTGENGPPLSERYIDIRVTLVSDPPMVGQTLVQCYRVFVDHVTEIPCS